MLTLCNFIKDFKNFSYLFKYFNLFSIVLHVIQEEHDVFILNLFFNHFLIFVFLNFKVFFFNLKI
jgi:hypothetical protein